MNRDPADTEGAGAIDQAAEAWLVRVRSGDPAASAAFEQWYAADPAHAEAYDRLLDEWDGWSRIAATPVGVARSKAASAPSRARRRLALTAAAAAALLVVVGVGFHNGHPDIGYPASATTFASRIGEIRKVALADGSHVTLDTDSSVSTSYSKQERHLVLMRGRARFDVVKDVRRPFVVVAGAVTVVAKGTRFDIAIADGSVSVALLDGTVALRSLGAGVGAAAIDLAAGQGVTLVGTRPISPPQPVAVAEARWPSGMLSFDHTPLSEVVAAANRYATAKIVVVDPVARELLFTGTVRAASPEALAKLLAATFGLESRHDSHGGYTLAMRRR